MTQHEKIIEMCRDGQYHCQIEFWNLFIRSPHKRRSDIEKGLTHAAKPGQYKFETRECEHNVKNGFDYKMVETKEEIQKYRPEIQERMEKERTLQTLFQL